MLGRPEPALRPAEQTFWYRCAKAAMRQAIPVGLLVIALLVTMGSPLFGIKWAYPDDRVLPASASARAVGDQLRSDFDINSISDVVVTIPRLGATTPGDVDAYAGRLSQVPDVTVYRRPAAPSSTATGSGQPWPPRGSPTAALSSPCNRRRRCTRRHRMCSWTGCTPCRRRRPSR